VHLIHLDPMLLHDLQEALTRELISFHPDLEPSLAAVIALPIIHVLAVLSSGSVVAPVTTTPGIACPVILHPSAIGPRSHSPRGSRVAAHARSTSQARLGDHEVDLLLEAARGALSILAERRGEYDRERGEEHELIQGRRGSSVSAHLEHYDSLR